MPAPRAHPRMRGENLGGGAAIGGAAGSSPHARGKQLAWLRKSHAHRLIPACAGKTTRYGCRLEFTGAHPRMRGENCKPGLNIMRWRRLIPACAGKTLADLDQHRAFEPIRYNLSRTITDIKPRQRREKLEPLSSKGSPPPLRGYPSI